MLSLVHALPQPTPPLFPYTTLFRSPRARSGARRASARVRPCRSSRGCAPRCRPRDDRQGRTDRKSTRLNSSHTVISYAVFCLKKKKTQKKEISEVHGEQQKASRYVV